MYNKTLDSSRPPGSFDSYQRTLIQAGTAGIVAAFLASGDIHILKSEV